MAVREAHRGDLPNADVVLGPCPGCELWQVDYTHAAAASFGGPETFNRAVEDLLLEHLNECRHLKLWLLDL